MWDMVKRFSFFKKFMVQGGGGGRCYLHNIWSTLRRTNQHRHFRLLLFGSLLVARLLRIKKTKRGPLINDVITNVRYEEKIQLTKPGVRVWRISPLVAQKRDFSI